MPNRINTILFVAALRRYFQGCPSVSIWDDIDLDENNNVYISIGKEDYELSVNDINAMNRGIDASIIVSFK